MRTRDMDVNTRAMIMDVFDDAQILRPQNSRELAAIRDNVMMLRAKPPGTPRPIGSGADQAASSSGLQQSRDPTKRQRT